MAGDDVKELVYDLAAEYVYLLQKEAEAATERDRLAALIGPHVSHDFGVTIKGPVSPLNASVVPKSLYH